MSLVEDSIEDNQFDMGAARSAAYVRAYKRSRAVLASNALTSAAATFTYGTKTGLDSTTADSLKKNISVYPNPFRDVLTVTAEERSTVHFYDMSGKMVGSHALVKGTNVLNPAALKPGVYLYQVKNTSGTVIASGKVIKK